MVLLRIKSKMELRSYRSRNLRDITRSQRILWCDVSTIFIEQINERLFYWSAVCLDEIITVSKSVRKRHTKLLKDELGT